MSPMTSALIDYWQRLPAESPSARRRSLDAILERVRSGLEARTALVPFALGDVDDGIVAAATQAYGGATAGAADACALLDAAEWIRRGLALNRGAVFGALLALEDERAIERLAGLRLALSVAEIETACRVLGPRPGARATDFLREWADLVGDSPLGCAYQALRIAVDGKACARAA